MIDFEIQGAIFDVDDTLLDNFSGGGNGLHERSRRAAIQDIGRRYGIQYMADITSEQNLDAFITAASHSIEAAAWNVLTRANVVTGDIDRGNELLKEIIRLKDELHGDILVAEGIEIADASLFIKSLAAYGLKDRLAIASSAARRDIDLFLHQVTDLAPYFPSDRIQSRETVTNFKPDPEAFDNAFRSLGLPDDARAQTLAFEDDPRGITSAHKAGLFTCAITTRFTKEEFEATDIPPNLIAGSYQEFAEILNIPLHP